MLFKLIFVLQLSLVLVECFEYKTSANTCQTCYKNTGTHCISADFRDSRCCKYKNPTQQKVCTSKYEFCTTNIKSADYKILTCPMYKCPERYGYFATLTKMNEVKTHYKDWSLFESGRGCKMVIRGDKRLNGKLKVKIESLRNGVAHVFQMPQHFSQTKYDWHGLFENNHYTTYTKSGDFYEVPSDWMVIVQYAMGHYAGYLKVSSSIEPYKPSDQRRIKTIWEPTGTSYIDVAAEAKRQEEERAALEAKLKAAKDKAEAERFRREAEMQSRKEAQAASIQAERDALIRLKIQMSADADIKPLVVTQLAIQEPDGLYFNLSIMILMAIVAIIFCLCGGLIVFLILRKIRKDPSKQQIIDLMTLEHVIAETQMEDVIGKKSVINFHGKTLQIEQIDSSANPQVHKPNNSKANKKNYDPSWSFAEIDGESKPEEKKVEHQYDSYKKSGSTKGQVAHPYAKPEDLNPQDKI